jgi:hypothetical protein
MDPTAPVSQLVLLLLTLVLTLVEICLELFVNVLMLVPVPAMSLSWATYLGRTPSQPPFPHKCLLSTLRCCVKRVSYLLHMIHG